MKILSSKDLRTRAGQLISYAERGEITLISKQGRPVLVALPFDGAMLEHGARFKLAAALLEEKIVSLEDACQLADLSLEAFLRRVKEWEASKNHLSDETAT